MFAKLMKRAEDLARTKQAGKIQEVAAQMGAIFGDVAIEIEEMRVLVRARGIIRRWLIDPSLRFLDGGLR